MSYTNNLIPQMTSYNTPSGLVIYNGNYSGYSAWNAFDGIADGTHKWASSSATGVYIGYKFDQVQRIRKYVIYGDTFSVTQSPKSWNLESSNNGKFSFNGGALNSDYHVLDNITNQINWSSGEKREFSINNNNSYLYYCLTNMSNNGGNVVAICEIQMMDGTTSKYLIKQNSNYYTVNSVYYDAITNHNFTPLTLTGGTNPNKSDIDSFSFSDLSVLGNSMNVGGDVFVPITKLNSQFELKMYKG